MARSACSFAELGTATVRGLRVRVRASYRRVSWRSLRIRALRSRTTAWRTTPRSSRFGDGKLRGSGFCRQKHRKWTRGPNADERVRPTWVCSSPDGKPLPYLPSCSSSFMTAAQPTRYCLPCHSDRSSAVDCALAGSSTVHSSLPVSASNARRCGSSAAAVKTNPPAVAIGPPKLRAAWRSACSHASERGFPAQACR